MSKDINLTSSDWTDIVFEGRNKEYGAYQMRQDASKRHLLALLIATTFMLFITCLPSIIKAIIPNEAIENPDGEIKLGEYTLDQQLDKKEIAPIEEAKQEKPKAMEKFTPPQITDATEVNKENSLKSQEELNETKGEIATQTREGSTDRNATETIPTNNTTVQEEEQTFTGVEQMPQFPGGDRELMAFISKNLKYPTIAAENGIEGRVVIRFVVSKTGEVTDVQILKGLDPSCDKEASRVIKSMPKWIPGRQNGRSVAVYYTLPLVYRLQR